MQNQHIFEVWFLKRVLRDASNLLWTQFDQRMTCSWSTQASLSELLRSISQFCCVWISLMIMVSNEKMMRAMWIQLQVPSCLVVFICSMFFRAWNPTLPIFSAIFFCIWTVLNHLNSPIICVCLLSPSRQVAWSTQGPCLTYWRQPSARGSRNTHGATQTGAEMGHGVRVRCFHERFLGYHEISSISII